MKGGKKAMNALQSGLWVLGGTAVTTVGGLSGVDVKVLTPSVLLGVLILLLMTGKIVHVSALDREKEHTAVWIKAYENESKARVIGDQQVSRLLDYARDTDRYIKSLAVNKEPQGSE